MLRNQASGKNVFFSGEILPNFELEFTSFISMP
jgi:hypothetical protein